MARVSDNHLFAKVLIYAKNVIKQHFEHEKRQQKHRSVYSLP